MIEKLYEMVEMDSLIERLKEGNLGILFIKDGKFTDHESLIVWV